MVPDIEWGKNIRTVLDIGCTDSGLASSLLDKDVLTLALGLKDDLVDLAQVSLERGFPAVISAFGSRRLPFSSGVFDAIHCGECLVPWHSNGIFCRLVSYFLNCSFLRCHQLGLWRLIIRLTFRWKTSSGDEQNFETRGVLHFVE